MAFMMELPDLRTPKAKKAGAVSSAAISNSTP